MTSTLAHQPIHTIEPGTTIPRNETLTIRDRLVVFFGTLTLQPGARLVFENCVLDTTQLDVESIALDMFSAKLELSHCQFIKIPKNPDPFQKTTSSIRTNGLCRVEAHHCVFHQTWNFATSHTNKSTRCAFYQCQIQEGYDTFVGDCRITFDHCQIENHRNAFVAFAVELNMSHCQLIYHGSLLEGTAISLSYSNFGIADLSHCEFVNLRAIEGYAGRATHCTFTDLGYVKCDRTGTENNHSQTLPSEFVSCQFIFTRHISKFTPWLRYPSLVRECTFSNQIDSELIKVRFGLIQANVEYYDSHIENCQFKGLDTQASYVILPSAFYKSQHGVATVVGCQFENVTSEHGQHIQTHTNSNDPVHYAKDVHVIQVSP